jgi:hypothetical protein
MNDTIAVLVLAVTNIVLGGVIIIREMQHHRLIHEMLKAVLSENLTDFTSSSIIEDEREKMKKDESVRAKSLPLESVTEDEFENHIKKINEA